MSTEPDNPVLTLLRRLDTKIDGVLLDIHDLKARMTTVGIQVGQILANEQGHYAAIMSRLDRVDDWLDRLERNADIIQA